MAKPNPFLKKATGTSKAPVSVVAGKKHGLGRSVDFGGGVGSLLGAKPVIPAMAGPQQALELKINDIERSPYQPRRDFHAEELHGAQIGIVNFAKECPWGFQIGLVNIIMENVIPVLPIVNASF